MLNNLFYYWLIAGIYCVLHGYIRLTYFMTEEKQEKVNQLCDMTNMSENDLILFTYGVLLLFGGLILPLWVLEWLYELFTGKELINFD